MALELDESRPMKAELGSKRSWPCSLPLLHMSAGSELASTLNERSPTPFPYRYPLSIAHLSLLGNIIQRAGYLFRTEWALAVWLSRVKPGLPYAFFVHLADVLILGSLCFVFLFIYHVNIGVQGHPKQVHFMRHYSSSL